jgi:hypothetical protein
MSSCRAMPNSIRETTQQMPLGNRNADVLAKDGATRASTHVWVTNWGTWCAVRRPAKALPWMASI